MIGLLGGMKFGLVRFIGLGACMGSMWGLISVG